MLDRGWHGQGMFSYLVIIDRDKGGIGIGTAVYVPRMGTM